MKFRYALLVSCVLTAHFAAAQRRPAEINLLDGAKLSGKIATKKWSTYATSIEFIDPSGNSIAYPINEIRTFSIKRRDGQRDYFERKTIDVANLKFDYDRNPVMERQTVIVQVLMRTPKFTLYRYQPDQNTTNFVVHHGDSLQTLIYKRYRRDTSERYSVLENTAFRQQLAQITADCPRILPKIERLNFRQKSLQELLKNYAVRTSRPVEYIRQPWKNVLEVYAIADVTATLLTYRKSKDALLSRLGYYDLTTSIQPGLNFGLCYRIPHTAQHFSMYSELGLRPVRSFGYYAVSFSPTPYSYMTRVYDAVINDLHLRGAVMVRGYFNRSSVNGFYVQGGMSVGGVINSSSQENINTYNNRRKISTQAITRLADAPIRYVGLIVGPGYKLGRLSVEARWEYNPTLTYTEATELERFNSFSLNVGYRLW